MLGKHCQVNDQLCYYLAMSSIVYLATNLINGKRYIGVTSQALSCRISNHRAAARGSRSNSLLHRAMRKYGFDMFRFAPLVICGDFDAALVEETRLIAALRPEYNSTDGGAGTIGFRYSDEQKALMSVTRMGRPGYWKGKKRPGLGAKVSATKRASPSSIARPWLNKTWTPEMRAKILATRVARGIVVGGRNKRAVRCLDDGLVFTSAAEAAVHYDCSRPLITLAVTTGRTAKGKRFEYDQ